MVWCVCVCCVVVSGILVRKMCEMSMSECNVEVVVSGKSCMLIDGEWK